MLRNMGRTHRTNEWDSVQALSRIATYSDIH